MLLSPPCVRFSLFSVVSSFLLSALLLPLFHFPPRRPYAGIFLSFVLLPSCSSYLFILSMYQVCFSSSSLPDIFASLHHCGSRLLCWCRPCRASYWTALAEASTRALSSAYVARRCLHNTSLASRQERSHRIERVSVGTGSFFS